MCTTLLLLHALPYLILPYFTVTCLLSPYLCFAFLLTWSCLILTFVVVCGCTSSARNRTLPYLTLLYLALPSISISLLCLPTDLVLPDSYIVWVSLMHFNWGQGWLSS